MILTCCLYTVCVCVCVGWLVGWWMLRKKEELLLVGSSSIKTNELDLGVVRVGLFVCVCLLSVMANHHNNTRKASNATKHATRCKICASDGWMDAFHEVQCRESLFRQWMLSIGIPRDLERQAKKEGPRRKKGFLRVGWTRYDSRCLLSHVCLCWSVCLWMRINPSHNTVHIRNKRRP